MSRQSLTSVALQQPPAPVSQPVTRPHRDASPAELLEQARRDFHDAGYAFARASLPARLLEIAVALTAMTLLAPVYVVIWVLVRRGSPGPALFCQTRIREGLRPFTFYKFRSLCIDGEQRFPELYQFDHSQDDDPDFMFKLHEDPRVTLQGRWLRSTSLDELPNFWNLLKGDIALVGPRPEIPEMLPNYETHMLKKFSVRPGITGLAQVSGRSDLSFREALDYDLRYVNDRCLALDIKILWLTFIACIRGEGAR